MGSRGPVARNTNSLAVVPVAKQPAPPRTLGAVGRATWKSTWTQCASWLTLGDAPIVERLARLDDERAELLEVISVSGRVAKGSMGQQVTHPHVDQLRQVEASILKHEQVLGIGPLHRARLGVTIAKLAKESSNADRALKLYRAQLEPAQ
jgi:P27 family predicted phage terminase small subunit